MKKHQVTLYVLLMITGMLQAQSYHFSQFFSTPLLTNPANTGYIEGPYRLSSNFRSQGSGPSPYFTGYLSADFNLLQNKLAEGHKAGAGIHLMNDQSLSGALQTNSVAISTAYHVGLDPEGAHSFGIGFQGAYHQKRIDYNKLSFGNQFGSNGYNAALPIGETLGNTNRNYFDLNAGIVYNINLEDRSYFGGISVYNILRHKENLLIEDFRMPIRYTIQLGGQVFIGEYGKAYLSLTHLQQANAKETTLGGAYGHQLSEDTKNEINFGMWYRYKDAIIPYIGYQRNAFQVGLSYDHTVSSLKTASQVRNGYELTLVYKALDKKSLKTLIPWY